MNNSLSTDRRFNITNLKEMYESNNRVLTSITQIHNENINSETINSLINNIITSNNEIMRNITNLLNTNTNTNTNTNNRQQNINRYQNRQYNNRQNSNSNSNSNSNNNRYMNEPIFNYQNSRVPPDARITNLINTFLEPIEIFPTLSQIESATRVLRFGDIIRPLNSACPITLENFNENDQVLIIRHCEHVFSNTGLISWFRTNCRCPVCRYDIRNYVSNHVSDLSGNIAISPTILPSPINSVERRIRNNSSNILVDLIFSNLIDTHNLTDISDNNISDASGNLLRLFFTP